MDNLVSLKELKPIEGLGTKWFFEIPVEADDNLIQNFLETEITNFNNKYSRFDSNSIISSLNIKKTLENPSIELKFLINIAIEYYTKSNNIFNFLLENELVKSGYGKRFVENSKSKKPNPIKDIEINDNKISIHNGGVDFGGFGKGYLIDLISKKLHSKFNLNEFIINGGGDIYSFSKSNTPRDFYLQHPIKREKYIGKVSLCNQSLTASSTFIRKWKNIEKKSVNHLINPKTNKSIEDCAVFVVSNSAMIADIWATTLSIAKIEEIKNLYRTGEFEFIKIVNNKVYKSPFFK